MRHNNLLKNAEDIGIFWCILLSFLSSLCAIDYSRGLANAERKTLTIAGLYATGSMTTFQNATGIIKTVEQALEYVNERSQILPGYKLEMQWRDTKVSWLDVPFEVVFNRERNK